MFQLAKLCWPREKMEASPQELKKEMFPISRRQHKQTRTVIVPHPVHRDIKSINYFTSTFKVFWKNNVIRLTVAGTTQSVELGRLDGDLSPRQQETRTSQYNAGETSSSIVQVELFASFEMITSIDNAEMFSKRGAERQMRPRTTSWSLQNQLGGDPDETLHRNQAPEVIEAGHYLLGCFSAASGRLGHLARRLSAASFFTSFVFLPRPDFAEQPQSDVLASTTAQLSLTLFILNTSCHFWDYK